MTVGTFGKLLRCQAYVNPFELLLGSRATFNLISFTDQKTKVQRG